MTETITSIDNYAITAGNYNSFFLVNLRHYYLTWTRLFWTALYALILLLIVALVRKFRIEIMDGIGTLVVAGIVIYLIIPVTNYVIGMVQFASGKIVKVRHHLSISENGIIKSSPLATVNLPWGSLYAVTQTRATILFFTNRRRAIIVPKSAFLTPEAAKEFATKAKTYWQEARG